MIFSSVLFLAVFLPAVLILYYILPRKLRNGLLLVASLLFYAWGEPVYVGIMLFSTAFDYTNGILIGKFRKQKRDKCAKTVLALSVIGNLAILGFFKYTDFISSTINHITGAVLGLLELALPIGISFYTFQTMSYTIDVYLGKAEVQRNILNFGAYVTLFPQLIAGPIVRYKDIQNELNSRKETLDDVAVGLARFVLGLGKKVLLANRCGAIYNEILTGELSTPLAWFGTAMFAFQIYFDFSGYSDMAIGLGRMMGFKFLENFDDPYTSGSVTDFWRRWHISLGTWFREYVYIPLGGNRKGKGRQIFNLSVVWLLTGLWHGASWNFVIWGAMFGVLLIIEKTFLLGLLNKLPKLVGWLYTMFFVLISWAIFANESMSELSVWLKAMFVPQDTYAVSVQNYLVPHLMLIVLCVFFSTRLPKIFCARLSSRDTLCRGVQMVAVPALLFVCIMFLVAETYNPFLYFRF